MLQAASTDIVLLLCPSCFNKSPNRALICARMLGSGCLEEADWAVVKSWPACGCEIAMQVPRDLESLLLATSITVLAAQRPWPS